MKDVWIPLGIVSAFSSAMVVICDKMGTRYIDSTLVGVIQTSATLAVLVGMLFYSNKLSTFSTIDMQVVPYIVASSLFAAIYYASYYLVVSNASASRAASLDQLSIVFIIYLAMVFLGEAVTWKSIIGSVLLLMGMGFMVL
ncbi:MAG: EamA family transporter [Candidatus Babeliales bacterium]